MAEEINKVLAMKEHFLTFVLNEMNDMILVQDLEFNIIWANKVAYKEARLLANVPIDQDIIGKKCYKVFYGIENPCIECALLKSIQTKKPQLIEKWDESKKRWYLYNVSLIFESNQLKAVAYISSDITEKKKMEEKLRETHQLQQLIFDNVGIAILTSNKEGSILNFNKGAEEIFGYKAEEVIGKNNKIFYREGEFEPIIKDIFRTIKKDGKYSGIHTFLTKSKKEVLISLTVTPILDSKNELKGYVGIAREMT
ncbi:MAG: PAS domain S-box protein [Candidatus Lokiarchaeota archaeon]|nr:PAS domain S-box protein [Candidatus Lokiarchaeota archaeon]